MNVFDLVLLIVGAILIFTGIHFLSKKNFSKSAIYGGIGLTMLVPALLHEKTIDVLCLVLLIAGALFTFKGLLFLLNLNNAKSAVIYGGIGVIMTSPVSVYVFYFSPMA
ncbi:hypothetical protein ACOMCU_00705 [Lysinibacillus sp. UGB7]|uniref:hypothetical protein n=1 Tax=Lysinibacillus sp. UGB7 TaxID=3411039 RepID=UPI003B7D20F1